MGRPTWGVHSPHGVPSDVMQARIASRTVPAEGEERALPALPAYTQFCTQMLTGTETWPAIGWSVLRITSPSMF